MIEDKLFHGIPAVSHKGKYIIFSPYANKMVSVNKDEIESSLLFKQLKEFNFFGKPQRKEKDDDVKITLFLTEKCNMGCVYCFGFHGKKGNRLEKELTLDFLENQIKKYPQKIFNIHFFGGEPTLELSLIRESIKFLKEKNIKTQYRINTNGIISQKNLDFLINNNFRFDISCDGPANIQNKQKPLINKGDSSPYVEKTIKYLVQENADFKTKSVITYFSTPEMPNIVFYLSDLGVKNIRLEPVILQGRAKESNLKSVNPKEFVKYFFKAVDVAMKKGSYISSWCYRNILEPKDYFCSTFKSNRIILHPKGFINKCYQDTSEGSRSNLGLFSNGKLFLDNNKISFLQSLSVEKMKDCQICFAKYICSGGCYSENYLVNKDFYKPVKEKCELTKGLLRNLIIQMHEKL